MPAPIIGLFLELMPDTISVRTAGAISTTGVVTSYGAATPRLCYISGKVRQIRDSSGQIRVSTLKVIVGGVFGLTVLDEYTLPSRFDPQMMPAIAVQHVSDENGPHHEVVFF